MIEITDEIYLLFHLLIIKHWHDKIASNKYALKIARLTGQFKSTTKIEKQTKYGKN